MTTTDIDLGIVNLSSRRGFVPRVEPAFTETQKRYALMEACGWNYKIGPEDNLIGWYRLRAGHKIGGSWRREAFDLHSLPDMTDVTYYNPYLYSWNLCNGWTRLATFNDDSDIYAIASINSLCIGSNCLFVGGTFTSISLDTGCGTSLPATNIAAYNIDAGTWSLVGNNDQTNSVTAIAVDTNENLYIGCARFYTNCATFFETQGVMIYSGGGWATVGTGLLTYSDWENQFEVQAMVASGTDIYVTGGFEGAYNGASLVSSPVLLKWSGSTGQWEAMDASGVLTNQTGPCGFQVGVALAVDETNLFISGHFYDYDGTLAPGGIAHFLTDGTWVSDTPFLTEDASGTCVTNEGGPIVFQDGNLYVGSSYFQQTNCAGTIYNGIAEVEGTSWLPMGSVGNYGLQYYGGLASVAALAADAEAVYVVGGFNTAGGITVSNNGLTRWVTGSTPDPCAICYPVTGSLNTARRYETTTLLPNGLVLAAGGYGPSTYLTSAEIYNPSNGVWTNTGSMNNARTQAKSALLPNGNVLVAGGQGVGSATLTSAEIYYPTNGTWSNTGSLNIGRLFSTLTLLPNGLVLAAAGANISLSIVLTNAELYNWTNGTWTYTGNLNYARQDHSATLLGNGQVLVAGGDDNGTTLDQCELYDPTNGVWTITGSLNTARHNHRAVLLPNGQVLVTGGVDSAGNTITSTELYDPISGTWTNTASMNVDRQNHTETLLPNGQVLVAGGENASGPLTDSEVYDPTASTPSWTATCDLNYARYGFGATLLPNGEVLMTGGYTGSASLSSCELYAFSFLGQVSTTTTSSLNTARRYETQTLMPNGLVVAAGGYGPVTYLSSAEVYNPLNGAWTNTGSVATAGTQRKAVLLPNGEVLVAGGQGSSPLSLTNADLYNPTNGAWSKTGALNTARQYSTLTLLPNGLVLAAAGTDLNTSTVLNNAELYDWTSGSWAYTSNLNYTRQDHSATLLGNGQVLVAGGDDNGTTLDQCELYDPTNGTWTITGSLNTARHNHRAVLLPNGQVLVTGGGDSAGNTITSAELYDPIGGAWSNTGSMNVDRQNHTEVLLPTGLVLVSGGQNGSGPMTDQELYNPSNGVWTATCPLNYARYGHAATLLPDGSVLLSGGYTGSASLSSVELFYP